MVCNECGKRKKLSEYAKRRSKCKPCQKACDRVRYEKRKKDLQKTVGTKWWEYYGKYDYTPSRVTIEWCPREEWPRLRRFQHGTFKTMLEDGVLTPGMHVTQRDKKYVVWGPKGEEQWLTRL